MENVFEINKDFDFSIINLNNPTPLTNGSYFSKISQSNLSKNIYIQLPKVSTKQGIIKNNNKVYCDLMFNSSEKDIVNWFESLEKTSQDFIFDKKELWFHNDINKEDIEEIMTPIIRSYKSVKFLLVFSCNFESTIDVSLI